MGMFINNKFQQHLYDFIYGKMEDQYKILKNSEILCQAMGLHKRDVEKACEYRVVWELKDYNIYSVYYSFFGDWKYFLLVSLSNGKVPNHWIKCFTYGTPKEKEELDLILDQIKEYK